MPVKGQMMADYFVVTSKLGLLSSSVFAETAPSFGLVAFCKPPSFPSGFKMPRVETCGAARV
jgi:hypothetical protein